MTSDLHRTVRDTMARSLPARPIGRSRGVVTSLTPNLRRAGVRIRGSDVTVSVPYPALPVALVVGDAVLIERSLDGWLMISHVLGRDASSAGGSGTQVSYPTSPAATVDYLARIKETADTEYRLQLGINASDQPQLLMGPGGVTVADLRAYRSGTKALTVDDGAAGNATVNVVGALQQNARPVAIYRQAAQTVAPLAAGETTLTAALNTWYLLNTANFQVTFTPDFVGQKFLIQGYMLGKPSATTPNNFGYALRVGTSTSPPATLPDAHADLNSPNGSRLDIAALTTQFLPLPQVVIFTAASAVAHYIHAYTRQTGGTVSASNTLNNASVVLIFPLVAAS